MIKAGFKWMLMFWDRSLCSLVCVYVCMKVSGVYECPCVHVPGTHALCDTHVSGGACMCVCNCVSSAHVRVWCMYTTTRVGVYLKNALENAIQRSVDSGLASLGR